MKIEFIPMLPSRDKVWLDIALPISWTAQMRGIIAMDTEVNRPVAAVLFDQWTHSAVVLHWWIDKPMVLRHGLFQEAAHYAFNVCEKTVVLGIMPSDSLPSLKLAKKLGFKETYRIKDGFKIGVDQVILEGRREDMNPRYAPAALTTKEEEAA